jgi:hypothetical protein
MTEAEWLAAVNPRSMLEHLGAGPSERRLRLFNCACVRRVWHHLPEGPLRRGVGVAERHADRSCDADEYSQAAHEAADSFAVIGGAGDLALELYVNPQMDWTADYALDGDERVRCWDTIRTAYQQTQVTREEAPLTIAKYEAATAAYLATFREVRLTGNAEFLYVGDFAAAAVSDAALHLTPPQEDEEERFMRPDAEELAAQCRLLRDVFGNPFRPAPIVDSAWLAWQEGTSANLARAAYDERRLPAGTLDSARLALLADALEDAGCTDAELVGHLRGPGPHVRGCWAVDLILSKDR